MLPRLGVELSFPLGEIDMLLNQYPALTHKEAAAVLSFLVSERWTIHSEVVDVLFVT